MTRTPRPYRRSDTVHGLFGWCVRQWPEATALVAGQCRLSYRELDELSDDYAVELALRGVGPGDFVPVVLGRSQEMIAVLLAILKRGAAYAALDPGWPRERVESILARLDARLVVAEHDAEWPVPGWTPGEHRGRKCAPVAVRGSDPAQVFFTSGSTGEPKGVIVAHRGTARLYDECGFGDFGPGTVQTQTMPLHWDGSLLDLWGPLCCGGASVFVDGVLHPELLRGLVAEQGLNTVCLPSAVFNMIMDEGPDAFTGVRYVNIGGEKVSEAHCARFLSRFPETPLTNTYGPVESTGIVTCQWVTIADTADPRGIPIGQPVTNSEVHIVTENRQCAEGTVGEICLSGDGLALGYLGDPELTARQFTMLDTEDGPLRVYHTGDLGLRNESDVLYYMGRADRQVKIRGHRIEPGEVERATERIPGVGHSVVLAVPGADGGVTALNLYYIAENGSAIEPSRLREVLAERLPSYLLPRDIHRMDAFPLTVNGKVDRRALLALDRAEAEVRDQRSTEPTGEPAATVLAICRSVLGRPVIELETPLPELGVNSLELARICTRLGAALGVSVPISQLYRTSTVTALSGWLRAAAPSIEVSPVEGGPFPLTTGQANYLASTPTTMCLLPWWIEGELDTAALRCALTDLHRRHQSLRAEYLPSPPSVRVPAEPAEQEFQVLAEAVDDSAALSTMFKTAHQPFDPEHGRLWRAVLVRSAESGRGLLGIAVHHIAFDGWSEALLTEDLRIAYAARRVGAQPVWERAVPTMAGVAAEHRAQLAVTDLAAQRDYWQRRLRGLPRLRLPGLRAAPAGVAGPMAGRSFTITAAELAPWDEAAKAKGANRFVYLVGVFGEVLRALTGQWDIGMLTPVATRGNALMDATVTCRINPLCLRLRRPPSARSSAWSVTRDAVNAAFAAQDLPFGEVVAAAVEQGPFAAVLGTLPIFLVQDHTRPNLDFPGCVTTFVEDRPGKDVPSALAVEVFLHPERTSLRIGVRTDLVSVELAERIGAEFLRILRGGPDQLG